MHQVNRTDLFCRGKHRVDGTMGEVCLSVYSIRATWTDDHLGKFHRAMGNGQLMN